MIGDPISNLLLLLSCFMLILGLDLDLVLVSGQWCGREVLVSFVDVEEKLSVFLY